MFSFNKIGKKKFWKFQFLLNHYDLYGNLLGNGIKDL